MQGIQTKDMSSGYITRDKAKKVLCNNELCNSNSRCLNLGSVNWPKRVQTPHCIVPVTAHSGISESGCRVQVLVSQHLWTSDLSLLVASKVVLIAKPPGFLLMNEHAFILGPRVALTPTALFKPSAVLPSKFEPLPAGMWFSHPFSWLPH